MPSICPWEKARWWPLLDLRAEGLLTSPVEPELVRPEAATPPWLALLMCPLPTLPTLPAERDPGPLLLGADPTSSVTPGGAGTGIAGLGSSPGHGGSVKSSTSAFGANSPLPGFDIIDHHSSFNVK